MTELLTRPDPLRPALPEPTLSRWQPLRLGLLELFHYDSEEFWFRDGHLLLRGNNGAGKSKVLSLTLPLLFDAQLKSSRIEPDGDAAKRMGWNLLMNSYERRTGYTWIEFGRVAEDGAHHFISLGAGLAAAAARPGVDSWFFVLEPGERSPRINRDVWLMSSERLVLTRDRLRAALEGRGQVFDTAGAYRRAVDERLFRLGTARYDALVDTLIQLRQPQLSRKPDEPSLSKALTEALPPLPPDLLGDVAEALGQLEEDRRQLEALQTLARAIERFEERYRTYASVQSRRQARTLRQAQTEFDNAARARSEAKERLDAALDEEANVRTSRDAAERALSVERSRQETLQADPAMQDANRLHAAERSAQERREASERAEAAAVETGRRLKVAVDETRRWGAQVEEAIDRLAQSRRAAAAEAHGGGLAVPYGGTTLAALTPDDLLALAPSALKEAGADLRRLVHDRYGQIVLLRRRQGAVKAAEADFARRSEMRDERRDDAEAARARRTQADADVEREGQALFEAWRAHFASLAELKVAVDPPLEAFADWLASLQGDNPAQTALRIAQQAASERLAAWRSNLLAQRRDLERERETLEDERRRLAAGCDAEPPASRTRDPQARTSLPGAPLWRVVEFRAGLDAAERARLESALEASGLLDAWVSPDGTLLDSQGAPLLDAHMVTRAPRPASLLDWLRADIAPGCTISTAVVERLLGGVAAGEPPADAEREEDEDAWMALDGRFRLGALIGAWRKPAAVYIGFAARAAARERRLAELTASLSELDGMSARVEADFAAHAVAQRQAEAEWRDAPGEQALRSAHLVVAAGVREDRAAQQALALAETRRGEAEQAFQAARLQLTQDATDLKLPEAAEALASVEAALNRFRDALPGLSQAAVDLRRNQPELRRQEAREQEALRDLDQAEAHRRASRTQADEAAAQLSVLREAIGAKVGELERQLAKVRLAVKACEDAFRTAADSLRVLGEARAVADEKAATADMLLLEKTAARAEVVARWQAFASTGLLASALPDIDLPDGSVAWTIDPALSLARRVDQRLAEVTDDDQAWTRVQRQVTQDFDELTRALSALGERAEGQSTDWGFVVQVIYQNRPERPDRLAARLRQEATQREDLLSAREREVFENHLQAEIASDIQHRIQSAERQTHAINAELHKRPTSTGVRYRLVWSPLDETDGAPVGLEAARRRLLNTNADLWSAEDRHVVGAMLQGQIALERERADDGGALFDQLARALDYRRWHRFRVERWQDGHWRKLSGPASSGERALGLTVPLFAAVASFYGQGGSTLAPRLILLDEAFAGIDDDARAHCMALIREFDLDFVLTSEREWGCYASLPGVSICQLQRREGEDAVFVSRWTWDGRARRPEPDPDRRFAPA